MTPYDLEQALRRADESAKAANFSDKVVITETFLLVRHLVQHAADIEAERRIALHAHQ